MQTRDDIRQTITDLLRPAMAAGDDRYERFAYNLIRNSTDYTQAFGKLLTLHLHRTGFTDPQGETSLQALSVNIPLWQRPERTTPYDPQLVKSWLTGEQLIPRAAWEGILEYFSHCPELGEETTDLMDELRSQARMHLPARQRFALSELNQTFRVRAAQPDNPADTLGISKTMISHLGNGTKGLNLARADATDKALQAQGIGGVPLTAIFWQQRHEQAQQEWDQAKSFGEQLTALRQALNLSQPALAQLAGVSNVTIHKWEGGHTSPLRFAKSEHFDNGRLDTLIHALEERQEQLKQDWPDSFIPPLNEMRQAQLRRSAHQIPLHQPAEHKSGYYYTDEQLSEMVVLQQHGVVQNEAAHLCGLHSPDHAIRRAHQLWGERFEKLDTPEREAATQRLAMRGIGPDGTLQTQLGSILPAERFQDKDNGKSR